MPLGAGGILLKCCSITLAWASSPVTGKLLLAPSKAIEDMAAVVL